MFRTRTLSFVLMFVLALVPVAASAQSTSSSSQSVMSTEGWTGGITGGATWSTLGTKDDTELKGLWGAVAGVFASKGINDNVGLQIEALVAQRGAKSGIAGSSNKLRLAYLDIPVLVKFGNMRTNDTHFHAFAGLTPGFKLKADSSDGILSVDIGNKVKTFDLGASAGVGVEQGAWSGDVRYTLGLVNINDSGGSANIKNRSLMAKIGYRFGR